MNLSSPVRAPKRPRLPAEYHRSIPAGPIFGEVNQTLQDLTLTTICVSGKCPNRGECFSRGSLAFMVLGNLCTRKCGFCAVPAGSPQGEVDAAEPERIGQAVARLKLRHAVITMVARDDLDDGGAAHLAATTWSIRRQSPGTIIELLISDLGGSPAALKRVLDAHPHILNHNLETAERITPLVRSRAKYRRSLELLARSKAYASSIQTKSGLMLGIGETDAEVLQTLRDLREVRVELLTLGQYLAPSYGHLPVTRFIAPADFERWKKTALNLGFRAVASGPLVRSSYFADQLTAQGHE